MFPRLRQQLLARLDLVVELSTLGEYGVDEHGRTMRLEPSGRRGRLAPRLRDDCGIPVGSEPCPAAEPDVRTARAAPTRP